MLPEAFVIQLGRDVMTPSISEVLWPLGGTWIQLRSLWIIHLDSRYGYTPAMLVRPVLLPFASIWDTVALWGQCLRILFEVLRHCEDNAYVPYLRYSGIVWTMPTYLPWTLGIGSGGPLCDLCICGLQLTFGYCSERTTLALWLFMAGHWLRSRSDLLSMRDTSTLWGQWLRISSYPITRYLIWRTTLWPLSLRLSADIRLLWWANYFSAMTADDWILTKKSSRTFCSPRWFGTMRRHLCVKNCFGDGTWGSMLFCIARRFCKGIWLNHFVLE